MKHRGAVISILIVLGVAVLQLVMSQVVTFLVSLALPGMEGMVDSNPWLFALLVWLTFSVGIFLPGWLAASKGWLSLEPAVGWRLAGTLTGTALPLLLTLIFFSGLEAGSPFFFLSIILGVLGFHLAGWLANRMPARHRSTWRTVFIIVALLAGCLIVIGPLAPVWQQMGLELVCITGKFPDLKIGPCAEEEEIVQLGLPTPEAEGSIPLIVDDDGSPDGMIALLYFLRNPLFDVRAVTISYGEAHPALFAPHVAQMLAGLGRSDIPVGYGSAYPLAGSNAFPGPWRQGSDDFWGITLPEGQGAVTPRAATALMSEVLANSDQPVMVFVSGAHTTLAQVLRQEPALAANIKAVYIMGGSVYVPGNIHSDWAEFSNETAEWNIWVDPLAASEVFASGQDLHLVPLDASEQVLWGRRDAEAWRAGEAPEGELAADLAEMMMNAFSVESVYIWDLVTAVQTTLPEVCPEVPLALEVATAPGADEGRTQVVEGKANIQVCLEPDAEWIKGLVAGVFQQGTETP